MTMSWKELQEASDDEIIAAHDHQARQAGPSVNYYLEEMSRRKVERSAAAAAKSTDKMVDLTWAIVGMTAVVTVATIVNVILAA